MFLFKKGEKIKSAINECDEEYRIEEVAYWRKANQIHDWFIHHLGLPEDFNCEYAVVGKRALEDLVNDCDYVLNEPSLAPAILPTAPGFFFGSNQYDEYYFEQLRYTSSQVKKIIDEVDWAHDTVEYYCWW